MDLDFQLAEDVEAEYLSGIPSEADFYHWVSISLRQVLNGQSSHQLTVRIVGEDEISQLNQVYRNKQGTTNVLSFPADLPQEINVPLLGDIVVCAAVVSKEAQVQHKPLMHHWAHMVVHGVLHLLGYDHGNDEEAELMESLETDLLSHIGIPNPYIETHVEESHERH